MNTTTSQRVERVRENMRSHNVDGLLLFNVEEASGVNIRYLTGFTGSASICFVTPNVTVLITDPRYGLQVKQESSEWDIRITVPGYPIIELLKEQGFRRLGLIGEEVSWERINKLREKLPEVELVSLPNIVQEIRAVKDAGEMVAIRKAVDVMEDVLTELYVMIKPGFTTDYELATALKIKLIQRGNDVAFDPIILSGSDSAFIHGRPFKLKKERERSGVVPSEKVIQRGDIVQFDVGCIVDGYASDISRVVVIGKAANEQKRMHSVLCNAIEYAKQHYREGARGRDGYDKADEILKAHGFKNGMVHGLGHGIGLEVHELPGVSRGIEETLKIGNVISLEPGIYIEGYGGMRIERDVLITENGPEFLDKLTTDLIEL